MSIIQFLSEKLGLEPDVLEQFIRTCPYRYKTYRIPKRNSEGYRTIAQPSRELKALQRLVMDEYFSNMPIHESATAYKKGSGVKLNAGRHKLNPYILKMDFKDFFPSICSDDLIRHIEKHGIMEISLDDKNSISRLFFYRRNRDSFRLELSIGAPSSPHISNSLMYDFDDVVCRICDEKGFVYTRYADDITISTKQKNTLYAVPDIIEEILATIDYPQLKINPSKTVFASKMGNRHVTGLVLTNDGCLSIGRQKKRYIRGLVFRCLNNKLDTDLTDYLKGYLSFCRDVEPRFIIQLENKFGKGSISNLLK